MRPKTSLVIPYNWLKDLWGFNNSGKGNNYSILDLRLYFDVIFFKDPLRNGVKTLSIKESSLRTITDIAKKDRLEKALKYIGFHKVEDGLWSYTLKENETYKLSKGSIDVEAWRIIGLTIWRHIRSNKDLFTYKLFLYILYSGAYSSKTIKGSKPVHIIKFDKLLTKLNIEISERKDLKSRYKNKVCICLNYLKEIGFIYNYENKGDYFLILGKKMTKPEFDTYLRSFSNLNFSSYDKIKKES